MRRIIITMVLLGSTGANAANVRYEYSGQEFATFTAVPEVEGAYVPGMWVSGDFVLSEALLVNTGAVMA